MKVIIIPLVLIAVLLLSAGPVFTKTSLVETDYAWIWGYKDTQVPEYLTENFDRILKRLARFFEVDIQNEKKILVWVVPFHKLQQLYYHQESPDPRKNIAALYDKKLNRLYFTPWYVKEYHITWGLVAYFTEVDEYSETMISALARRLVWQNLAKELMDEGAGKL